MATRIAMTGGPVVGSALVALRYSRRERGAASALPTRERVETQWVWNLFSRLPTQLVKHGHELLRAGIASVVTTE